MAKQAKTWSWRGWLPDISAAVDRFPAPIAFAVLFTLYELYHGSNLNEPRGSGLWGRLPPASSGRGPSISSVESTGRTRAERIALSAAGVLVIAVMFWLAWSIWLSPYLLIGGLLLLVGLAAYPGPERSSSSFWLFNQRLWLGAAVAGIGAVLGVGLSSILKTLNVLFGLDLSGRWYERIWTLSLGLIAPVSALAFAPRSFTDTITERDREDFIMRAAAALVKFVLVPLLLVYTAILYAYALKIVLEWTLPKGTLGS